MRTTLWLQQSTPPFVQKHQILGISASWPGSLSDASIQIHINCNYRRVITFGFVLIISYLITKLLYLRKKTQNRRTIYCNPLSQPQRSAHPARYVECWNLEMYCWAYSLKTSISAIGKVRQIPTEPQDVAKQEQAIPDPAPVLSPQDKLSSLWTPRSGSFNFSDNCQATCFMKDFT